MTAARRHRRASCSSRTARSRRSVNATRSSRCCSEYTDGARPEPDGFEDVARGGAARGAAPTRSRTGRTLVPPRQQRSRGARDRARSDDVGHRGRHFRSPDHRPALGSAGQRPAPVVVAAATAIHCTGAARRPYECADLVAAPLTANGASPASSCSATGSGDVGTFGAADGRVLSALARYTSIALENGRLVDELQCRSGSPRTRSAPRPAHRPAEPPLPHRARIHDC